MWRTAVAAFFVASISLMHAIFADQFDMGEIDSLTAVLEREQGAIESVDLIDSKITVEKRTGKVAIRIDPDTRIFRGEEQLSLLDLDSGMRVTVFLRPATSKKTASVIVVAGD